MQKLMAMLEDTWVAVAFAEHDTLPPCIKTGREAGSAIDCLSATTQ